MVRTLVHDIEKAWDDLKRDWSARLSDRLGVERDTPLLAPYRGFGTAESLWFRGRVLEDEGVISALHSDSLAVNLRHTYKRYETDEIPGATIRWSHESAGGETAGGTLETDREGFFEHHFQPRSLGSEPWTDVHVLLEEAPGFDIEPLGATVRVRVPGRDARFGIISDIDDTIVYTGAHDFLKHWRTVVANSAHSRECYDGLPALYQSLTDGERNPIFYVSSSPWNLFDLFERYMSLNDIPLGPMLLKDFGLDDTKWLTGGHDGHKTMQIERVFETYPDLPFILIGDSGQRDAAIYADIVEKHGDRVAAVLIHEVTPNEHEAVVADMRARLTETPHMVTTSYPKAHAWLRELGFAG